MGRADADDTERLANDGGPVVKMDAVRLTVHEGADAGTELVPDRPVARLGSGPRADLRLTDPSVSQLHCELSLEDGWIRIRDLGSSNGTLVDGYRVHDVHVRAGTVMTVGRTRVRIATSPHAIRVPLSSAERFGALIGRSVAMRELFAILERVAATDTTLLIEGESGTGKELAAEAVHAHGKRADRPFVAFDCGAVPRELAESALFGHVRGAFTGAVSDREGAFEEANGGTLLLDELGELPLDLQPKLLRALEKREIRRVGDGKVRPVDVRVIAATNRRLEEEIHAGRFREDLYYRVAVIRVVIAPLRARPDDIPLLVDHFVRHMAPRSAELLSQRTIAALASQPWPGNVRELRNAVERALCLLGPEAFRATGQSDLQIAGNADAASVDDLGLPYYEARQRLLEHFHRRYFEAALRASGGNVSAAARKAGVNRKLIQRVMEELGWPTGPTEDPDDPPQ